MYRIVLSNVARLIISSSESERVTIALRRSCSPFRLRIISRAAIRPIRPNPYRITSFGVKTLLSWPMESSEFVGKNAPDEA